MATNLGFLLHGQTDAEIVWANAEGSWGLSPVVEGKG